MARKSKQTRVSKIPTPEEFKRADEQMAHLYRNLDQVAESFMADFRYICPETAHGFYIFAHEDNKFVPLFFFKKEKDTIASITDGTRERLIARLESVLAENGRGKPKENLICVEFDSDENVQRVFKGNYFYRLR